MTQSFSLLPEADIWAYIEKRKFDHNYDEAHTELHPSECYNPKVMQLKADLMTLGQNNLQTTDRKVTQKYDYRGSEPKRRTKRSWTSPNRPRKDRPQIIKRFEPAIRKEESHVTKRSKSFGEKDSHMRNPGLAEIDRVADKQYHIMKQIKRAEEIEYNDKYFKTLFNLVQRKAISGDKNISVQMVAIIVKFIPKELKSLVIVCDQVLTMNVDGKKLNTTMSVIHDLLNCIEAWYLAGNGDVKEWRRKRWCDMFGASTAFLSL